MTGRRELFLKEMGLDPVWRLKPKAAEPLPPADIQTLGRVELEALVANCTACGLCKSRTRTVFGVGDENADWLFVGEAPGEEEDAQGEPFVGPAGKLLDNMLKAIGLKRGDNVYIANVLKCRPPDNHKPLSSEVAKCKPYLDRQIGLIRPRLIVSLGKTAAQTLLGEDVKVSDVRGKVHSCQGIPLIATYHPAYLLRTLHDKALAWEDLCLARETMQGLISDESAII